MDEKYRKNPVTDDSSRDNEYHFVDVDTDSARNEEFASEFTADDYARADSRGDSGDVISSYGWIGIALSVISFFMWPFVLGAAGIILGFVSRSKGADTLGNIAIAAGVISIIMTLFFRPFF
ncbi:hypothetical protein CV093_11915 [Oceanobacillus sp. 143]|uniref:DUF4190 domain-containing protein n=1 Tax=Oceanobacillus zhaokaii TaxID=2052660 RepID=A0A345PHJ1_9BACI|nr:hypothetical protein [Oceanobacillus zhaokaii]AXI09471.1 hypothetical protein CUC15_11325 [Oceanobacillus zhaokaii]QGS68876.1 hypothetical protein CV093_11915 [Oceanobacillus sp. 143]